jgi:hypothetical protein
LDVCSIAGIDLSGALNRRHVALKERGRSIGKFLPVSISRINAMRMVFQRHDAEIGSRTASAIRAAETSNN